MEGAVIEELTLDGGIVTHPAFNSAGLRYSGGATNCAARRLRIVSTATSGIEVLSGPYSNVWFEDISIANVGSHGINVNASSADGLFIKGLTIEDFGHGSAGASYGARSNRRCHLSELHVGQVSSGDIGVGFLAGSEYSTLSNYYIRLAGGTALSGTGMTGISVGVGTVQ